MIKIRIACVLLLASLLANPAFAAGSIELKMKAEKDVQVINDKGEKQTKRIEAVKALPGEEVIYTISYANNGKEAADKVIIANPVPEHMIYVDNTATNENALVTYSVDGGKTYAEPGKLKVRKADGAERQAVGADYTHVRWVLRKPIQPGATGNVSFHARLK